MGNIENYLAAAICGYTVSIIDLAQRHRISPCFFSDNRGFENDRQQGGLELDYIQFGCVVQLTKLAVTVTCQQGRLKLDYVPFGCVVQLEELAVIVIRQQGGLYLDSGWTTPGEQAVETTGVTLP